MLNKGVNLLLQALRTHPLLHQYLSQERFKAVFLPVTSKLNPFESRMRLRSKKKLKKRLNRKKKVRLLLSRMNSWMKPGKDSLKS
jgi:hypothetical protein